MIIKRPLLLLTGGFVLGEVLILQGSVVMKMLPAVLLAAFGCVLLWSCAASWTGRAEGRQRSLPQRNRLRRSGFQGRSLWWWLLPIFVCAGMLRGFQAQAACEREMALDLDGRMAEVRGKVDQVSEKQGRVTLTLKDGRVRLLADREETGTLGRIQVYVDGEDMDRLPGIGTLVSVRGECSGFDAARNPGEFDYRTYYRSLKLNYRMSAFSFEVVDGDSVGIWDRYRDGLNRLSMWSAGRLEILAGQEDAGIFRAVLLGDRSGLSEDIRDMYQKNGIAHLLAVSGLHLSMVSLAVYGIFRRLGAGYGAAGLAGGLVLISFALMTGASPSVIRALIMALCGFLAAYLGRTYDLLSALCLSALWLLWDSPYLLSQAGVQLSFGAIIGIGGLAPCLRPCMDAGQTVGKTSHPQRGQAGQGILISVSMQLVTLPMILYHFFQYPLYGIFLNLLVVPLMGVVLASGAAGIALSGLSLAAGRFAVGSGCAVLGWYELCCGMFERLPGSSVILGRPQMWQIGAYYGALAAVAWMAGRGGGSAVRAVSGPTGGKGADGAGLGPAGREGADGARRGAAGEGSVSGMNRVRVPCGLRRSLLPLMLLMLSVILLPLPVRGLKVTFLDVGQGDGICLQTRRSVVLVDGGSSDRKDLGKNRLEPFLKSSGIRSVDWWVVSHGDQDHVSGLVWMLEESGDIAIKNLILPAAGYGNEAYDRLVRLAGSRGTDVFWMTRGERLDLGDLTFGCLYPEATVEDPMPAAADRNEHSLVLRADYGAFHLLMTGDMSGEGEEKLLRLAGNMEEMRGDILVLKVAHHGSRFSSTEKWLDAVHPGWAVVSYGQDNRYGHPHEETLERFAERDIPVFGTGDWGAVILNTDGETLRWSLWRSKP